MKKSYSPISRVNVINQGSVLRCIRRHFTHCNVSCFFLTLLHSERPKLYTILAFLSAKGLNIFHKESTRKCLYVNTDTFSK